MIQFNQSVEKIGGGGAATGDFVLDYLPPKSFLVSLADERHKTPRYPCYHPQIQTIAFEVSMMVSMIYWTWSNSMMEMTTLKFTIE